MMTVTDAWPGASILHSTTTSPCRIPIMAVASKESSYRRRSIALPLIVSSSSLLLLTLFLLLHRAHVDANDVAVAVPEGDDACDDKIDIDRRDDAGDVDDEENDDYDDDYDDDDPSSVYFPPIVGADDVAHFFSTYDLDGLHWALSNVYRLRDARHRHHHHYGKKKKNNRRRKKKRRELPAAIVSRGGGNSYTSEYKLRHDLDQANYLANILDSTDRITSTYFRDVVIPAYETVLEGVPPLDMLTSTDGLYAFTSVDYATGMIGDVYNAALYSTTSDEIDPEWRGRTNLLDDRLDWDAIQREWFGEEEDDDDEEEEVADHRREEFASANGTTTTTTTVGTCAPGVVVIDDILSPETLSILRDLLLRNTHWFQTKTPLRFGKYVGSYIDDGLDDPIFLQVAREIHQSMPRIMHGHPLRYMWAYKYDSEWENGINLHADMAAVNVNIWLSADGADLEEEGYGGGMIVYTARPPSDWPFESYNTDTDLVVERLLRPTDFANVTVHHRPNRAVIFDSALFHQTERYRFRSGYENGRINLTFLFGEMRGDEDGACSSTTTTADR